MSEKLDEQEIETNSKTEETESIVETATEPVNTNATDTLTADVTTNGSDNENKKTKISKKQMNPKKKKTIIIASSIIIAVVAVVISILFVIFKPSPTFELGVCNENVYKNEFSKIKFALPSGMTLASDTEKASAMGSTSENETIDLYAYDDNVGVAVAIIYDNLAKSTDEKDYTATQYANVIKKEYGNYTDATIKVSEFENVKIAGKEYLMMKSVLSTGSDDIIEKLYFRRIGDYMVSISFTGYLDSNINDVAKCFTKLN